MNLKPFYKVVYSPILFFGIAIAALGLIPFISNIPGTLGTVISYAAAALFWGFLIAGITSISSSRRKLYPVRKRLSCYGMNHHKGKPGIISFSAETKHLAVYAVCIVGLLLCIADIVFDILPMWLLSLSICASLLAFVAHCVVDGNNYITLKLLERILEEENENIDD